MAKFAKCGYGSQGQGLGRTKDGYTYIVNDNVRTGDRIQVVATNWKSQKKFATTAVPLHTYKETSVKGQQAKQELDQKGIEATQVYSGAELGVSGKGYKQQVRAGNIGEYIEKNPEAQLTKNAKSTFEEYSQQFMNKGEQE